jgi:NAD(P)-dependent dehydrogenase (short-subunit alcohol dehydrogenase family)
MGFLYSQLFVRPAAPTQSFAGQTVIVTGSNTGLGKEAARHIARLGAAKLILAVRNVAAGEAAKRDIEATTRCGASTVEVWKLDLASYESVRAFAGRVDTLPRVDVLLENAGIAAATFGRAEGHERTVTVNVISTFLLALLVLPKLKETANKFKTDTHLSVVSSEVHAWCKFPERDADNIFEALDDPANTKSFGERYPVSKLLEVLVIRAIAPSLAGTGVILDYLNPGLCHSELSRDAGFALTLLKFFLARSTELGSRTLVAAAAAPPAAHGKYMTDALVDDAALSPFVKSPDGAKAATKVWTQLAAILEQIQPGVTKNL